MKRFLIIALCLFVPLLTGARARRLVPKIAAAGGSNITADLWQTFENATLNATNLDATDNCATGTWTVTDASSKLSVIGGAESATVSTVNSTADTGTLGLSYSLSGGAVAYLDYAPATAKNDITVGFWYTTATPAGWDAGPTFFVCWDDANGSALLVRDERDGGDSTRQLTFVSGTTVKFTTGITNATKYWISVRFVRNGTGKISIYNSSGVQQGSTTDITCNNYEVTRMFFGSGITITTQAQSVYFDDIVMNWTAPSNIIGP